MSNDEISTAGKHEGKKHANAAKRACAKRTDNARKKPKSLTPKQLHFCRCRANGMSLTDSYKEAYNSNNMSNKTINEAASRLGNDSMVSARIDHLIAMKEKALIRSSVSVKEKVLLKLEHFMDNATSADMAKIRAAELLGKSIGLFKDVIEEVGQREMSSDELTELLYDKINSLAKEKTLQ